MLSATPPDRLNLTGSLNWKWGVYPWNEQIRFLNNAIRCLGRHFNLRNRPFWLQVMAKKAQLPNTKRAPIFSHAVKWRTHPWRRCWWLRTEPSPRDETNPFAKQFPRTLFLLSFQRKPRDTKEDPDSFSSRTHEMLQKSHFVRYQIDWNELTPPYHVLFNVRG